MPYGMPGQNPIPSRRKRTVTPYIRADGTPAIQVTWEEVNASSPDADIDTLRTYVRQELPCGCFCPPAEVIGVCSDCVAEGTHGGICRNHHAVCSCGKSVCWKHSHPAAEGSKQRLCLKCYRDQKWKTVRAQITSGLGRILKSVFFKSS